MKAEKKMPAQWQKTQYANLFRYKSSGIYFARLRVAGKLVRKSLKTHVITTAKLRLGDLEKEERNSLGSEQSLDNGKLVFADALSVYQQRLEGNANLKKRTVTKKFRRLATGR